MRMIPALAPATIGLSSPAGKLDRIDSLPRPERGEQNDPVVVAGMVPERLRARS